MRHSRPSRRRGDWARRLPDTVTPSGSDSDLYPCDSSCSGDSLTSQDTTTAAHHHMEQTTNSIAIPSSSSDLFRSIAPLPLDVRSLSFPEYAAAELPDVAIFFRSILSPFSPPPPTSPAPHYSASNPRFSRTLSSPSSSRSRTSRRSYDSSSASSSKRLPPTFPETVRQRSSYPPSNHSVKQQQPQNRLRRATTTRIPRLSSLSKNNESGTNTKYTNGNKRASTLVRCDSCPPVVQGIFESSWSSKRSTNRKFSRIQSLSAKDRTRLGKGRMLTSRRRKEDMPNRGLTPPARIKSDPDKLDHWFLMESLLNWYTHIMIEKEQVRQRGIEQF